MKWTIIGRSLIGIHIGVGIFAFTQGDIAFGINSFLIAFLLGLLELSRVVIFKQQIIIDVLKDEKEED